MKTIGLERLANEVRVPTAAVGEMRMIVFWGRSGSHMMESGVIDRGTTTNTLCGLRGHVSALSSLSHLEATSAFSAVTDSHDIEKN